MSILPINLIEVPKINPVYNPHYVYNLIANGVIQDFYIPGAISTNPIFAQANDLNEKIGIIQTATKGIDTILNYIDTLKEVNPNEEKVISDLVNEINSTIKNTTYNSLPVFTQTLKIGDKSIDLSIPLLDLNKTTIEEYEKFLNQKQKDLFNTLENISLELPANTKFSPFDIEFESLLNSGLLTTAYKENLINPYTLQLLFQ